MIEILEYLFYKILEFKFVEFLNFLLIIKEGVFWLMFKFIYIDFLINFESIGLLVFWDFGLEVFDFNYLVDIGEKVFYENSNLIIVWFNYLKIMMNMYLFGLN